MPDTLNRPAAVAGTFYPADPKVLRAQIETLLKDSETTPAPNGVQALLVPHAGYPYSGATAAAAFRRASGATVKRVVLMGCSHHFAFDGASIPTTGNFQTPLGDFPIDTDFAVALVDRVGSYNLEPHITEHALEVELPLIAVAIGIVPIVPILFGSRFSPWHQDFAQTLADLATDGTLIVASSDLSHYLDENHANAIDRHTLDTVLQQDVPAFVQGASDGSCSMCGVAAVATAMTYSLLHGADDWTLLDYRTSAKATADSSRVVGYAAVSMEKP